MSDEEHGDDSTVVHTEQMNVCLESTKQVEFIPCINGDSTSHKTSDLEIQDMTMEEIYPANRKGMKTRTFCGLDPTKKCWGTTVKCKQMILTASCFVSLLLLVFFAFAIIPIRTPRRPINPLSNASATTKGQIRVLLLGTKVWHVNNLKTFCFYLSLLCLCYVLPGDSVLGIPSRKSGLVLKLGALIPQYFMNVAVSGKLGVKMYILLPRVANILKKEKPDVVILYTDSDLSNQKEYTLSVQEKFDVRQHYRNNYTLVVEKILATGVKLAISGEFFFVSHPCSVLVNAMSHFTCFCPSASNTPQHLLLSNTSVAFKLHYLYLRLYSSFITCNSYQPFSTLLFSPLPLLLYHLHHPTPQGRDC